MNGSLDSPVCKHQHPLLHPDPCQACVKEERDAALAKLIEEANARVAAMSPEERAAMWQAQKESWVRGEMGFGSDADEAEWVRQHEASKAKPTQAQQEALLQGYGGPNPPNLLLESRDGTIRKAYYGPDGEQPWDTALRLGWAHGFAATNVLKYLRRVKHGQEAHSLESARVYWNWLNQLAGGGLGYTGWFDESGVALLQLVGSLTPQELDLLQEVPHGEGNSNKI